MKAKDLLSEFVELVSRRTGEIVKVPKRSTVLLADGSESGSDVPMAPPIGYKKQKPLALMIREMVISEKLRQEVEAIGKETFEESEDFDVGDDYDPFSPYENDFDPDVRELVAAGREAIAAKEALAKPASEPRSSEVPLLKPEAAPGGGKASGAV